MGDIDANKENEPSRDSNQHLYWFGSVFDLEPDYLPFDEGAAEYAPECDDDIVLYFCQYSARVLG